MGTEQTKRKNNGVIYSGTYGNGCSRFILRGEREEKKREKETAY